ncbi:MAG: hypothetical protein IJS14_02815 [Lentisphaeria bacterium]|nr:hypothetical protein [Lentisphaeria bacterium]
MNKQLFFAVTAALSLTVSAENLTKLPETTYRIYPGQWNRKCLESKTLSKLIRTDVDPATGKGLGKLIDGDSSKSAVSYNFHGVPAHKRVINVEFDLGKPCAVTRVRLWAFRNNNMYDVAKVVFYGSGDRLVWKQLGEIGKADLKYKNYRFDADLTGGWAHQRYIRIAVHAADTWLNLSEALIEGTPDPVKGKAAPRSTSSTRLKVKAAPAGQRSVLFLQTRLALPRGEETGKHLLELTWNGRQMSEPLNREMTFVDSQSGEKFPIRDEAGRWLVRADADYLPFNAPAGHPYSNTRALNRVNSAELADRFYHYAFLLDGKAGEVELTAKMPPKGIPLEISGFKAVNLPSCFFFSRDWMQTVLPTTFPTLREIGTVPSLTVAGNETGVTACPLYCFEPTEGKLELTMPGGRAELFEIHNTPVKFSQEYAAANAVPNLGAPILPEWWLPEPGAVRKFEKGSSAFVLRFRPDPGTKPGRYAGKLTLRNAAGKELASTKIDYEILPFDLPDHDSLPFSGGLYIMGSGSAKRGEEFWQDIRDHGITQIFQTPWGTPIKLALDKEGKLTADFSNFNSRHELMKKRGFNRRMMFFGTSEPMIGAVQKLTGQKVGEPEFNRRFKEFMTLFVENNRQFGIPIRLSFYDEANFQPEAWKKTLILTKLAKEVPGARVWMTSTANGAAYYLHKEAGYKRDEDMVVTHPSSMLGNSDDTALPAPGNKKYTTVGEVRKFHLRGEYETIYAYPGEQARFVYGLRSYRSGLEVFFAFAFWWGHMEKYNFTPTKRYYINIPFGADKDSKPGSTLGWESVRAGMDDYRYLALAEQKLAKKIGKEAARQKILALIRVNSPHTEDFSPDHYNEVRKAAIRIIQGN